MNRRDFSSALLATGASTSLLLASGTARAQAPVEGRDYTLIQPPQPPATPAKIEVCEFFSYACPHCSAFEPMVGPWSRTLPGDVVFRRIPVSFLFNAENFQRTYFALEATGLVEQMQSKVFAAVHVDRQRLDKPEDIAALVTKNGGDGAKFLAAFKSFSVATSVTRAKKMVADYKVDSVPTLVVAGRWMTSPSTAGSQERSLQVVEQLAQKARTAK